MNGKFLTILAPAIILAVSGTTVIGAAVLKRGTYVNALVSCGVASNSTLMKFDGQTFTGGRSRVNVTRSGSSYTGNDRDESGALIPETYEIKSATRFVLVNQFGKIEMRYCSKASLPPMWRD